MDFDYYKNFVTIVETGSLTAASQKLNLAQPALSAQIKNLEQSYGIKLLKLRRGVRRLELTEAGEIFYERAKYLCSIEETTRIEIQNCSNEVSGLLKVSLSPARAPLFVKQFIRPFCECYPKVHYQINEVDVNTQAKHVLDGTADFAIANAPLPEPQRFNILLSQKEHFIVAVHRENTWIDNSKTKIKLKDLKEKPLCTNFGSFELLSSTFLALDIKPNFISISTTRATALQFAEQNLGIAVLPADSGEILSSELHVMLLTEKNLFLTKTVFASKTQKPSQTAETFLQYYLEKAQKII